MFFFPKEDRLCVPPSQLFSCFASTHDTMELKRTFQRFTRLPKTNKDAVTPPASVVTTPNSPFDDPGDFFSVSFDNTSPPSSARPTRSTSVASFVSSIPTESGVDASQSGFPSPYTPTEEYDNRTGSVTGSSAASVQTSVKDSKVRANDAESEPVVDILADEIAEKILAKVSSDASQGWSI